MMVAIFSISRYILAHALPHSADDHDDWQRPRRRTIYICDVILFSSSRSQRRPGILRRQRRRRRITSHRRQRSHAICHHESRSCSAVPSSIENHKMDILLLKRNGKSEWARETPPTFFGFLLFILFFTIFCLMCS